MIEVPEEEQGEPATLATAAFVESIRQNTRPFADEHVGWGSGLAVAHGNVAIYEGRRVEFDGRPQG